MARAEAGQTKGSQFRCLGLFDVLCSLQCLPLALFQYVRHCRHLRYHREPQAALNTLVCNFVESKVSFFTVVHNYKNIYDSMNLPGLIVDSPPILIFFLIHTWKNTDANRNLSLDPSACTWVVHKWSPMFPLPICSPALNITWFFSSRLGAFLNWFAVFALCFILYSDISVQASVPSQAGYLVNLDTLTNRNRNLRSLWVKSHC